MKSAAASRLGSQEKRVRLDLGIYAREAVSLAAAIFADRADVYVEEDGKQALGIVLESKRNRDAEALRALSGEFMNEVLNQDLRLEVVRDNAGVMQMLVATVLGSASSASSTENNASRPQEGGVSGTTL